MKTRRLIAELAGGASRHANTDAWQDEDVMWYGLAPGETRLSYPFLQNGAIGICELRLFYSPKRLRFFLFPPDAAGRGAIFESIDVSDLEIIKMKAIHYSTRKSLL